jgi:DNA-binding NarL/FixJ family response regulator
MLADSRRSHTVAEAADGLHAIESARTLQPDFILLDIELSPFNGIETARRILAAEPGSKVIFMSAHRSWDIAEVALATGARGYLLKADAGRELLPALDAVAAGGRFISGALVGRLRERYKNGNGVPRPRCHEVAFCRDHGSHLDALAHFTEAALSGGKTVMAATVSSRRHEFHDKLQARSVDVDLAISQGRYVPLDVSELLSQILVADEPDEQRFWNAAVSLVAGAARASGGESRRIAICGEGCGTLAAEGRVDTAVRLEHLWDEFAKACNVEIFCTYSPPAARDEAHDVVRRITAKHSAVHRDTAPVPG